MTEDDTITYEDLEMARENLISTINNALTENDRKFLLSFKQMSPQWEYLELDNIQNMPAIKWKL